MIKTVIEKNLEPALVFHPGETIEEEITARWRTQEEFANILGKPQSKLNSIIKGKANITSEWAILIGKALGTSPNLWLGLQQEYDLYKAKKEIKAEKLEDIWLLSALKSSFPIKEMIKFWYIENIVKPVNKLRDNICKFLKREDWQPWDKIFTNSARCRKTDMKEINDGNLQTRFQIAANRAKEKVVGKYDKEKLKELMTISKEFIIDDIQGPKTFIEELEKCWVVFVTVRHFEKTRIHWATFWIDDTPVIALSLRYDRYDNFRFTLFHEIWHILKHKWDKQWFYDNEEDFKNSSDKNEQEANLFAHENLISKEHNQYLPNLQSILQIINFCTNNKLHRSILIWRLRHEGYLSWSKFNKFYQLPIKDKINLPEEFYKK